MKLDRQTVLHYMCDLCACVPERKQSEAREWMVEAFKLLGAAKGQIDHDQAKFLFGLPKKDLALMVKKGELKHCGEQMLDLHSCCVYAAHYVRKAADELERLDAAVSNLLGRGKYKHLLREQERINKRCWSYCFILDVVSGKLITQPRTEPGRDMLKRSMELAVETGEYMGIRVVNFSPN